MGSSVLCARERTGHERSNEDSHCHLPDDLDHDGGISGCGDDPATISRLGASFYRRTGLLPALTPIIAFFLAFGQAMSMTRKRDAIDGWMLARYFLGAPIRIFLTLLAIISLLTFVFAPITFVVGLAYGAVPLLVGTAIHLFGVLPLYFMNRWLKPRASSLASSDIR